MNTLENLYVAASYVWETRGLLRRGWHLLEVTDCLDTSVMACRDDDGRQAHSAPEGKVRRERPDSYLVLTWDWLFGLRVRWDRGWNQERTSMGYDNFPEEDKLLILCKNELDARCAQLQ